MPRPSGLRIEPRLTKSGKPNGFTITGSVAGQRVRARAQSLDAKLARDEAIALEKEICFNAWHGERRGVRSFSEAVLKYYEAQPPNEATKARYRRILHVLGDKKLGDIDQDTVTLLRGKLLRPDHRPATVTREIVSPLRAVLKLAQERDWCTAPKFRTHKEVEGRTLYLLPDEAERLIAAAGHLRPLVVFLLSTGARMGEAIYLDWDDRAIDLSGGQVIFFADQTKAGKRRITELPPRAVAELANLPHREGAVFRRPDGLPYIDRRGRYGGQIKTAFKATVRRAGLNPAITPHILRHTWATWHYALHRDPLLLKQEGGWSTLALVERYAKLMPNGLEAAIQRFYRHLSGIDAEGDVLSA
jgi:integrase